MSKCFLCPRRCGADREAGERGFCGQGDKPVIARAAPHYGEEPCISGIRGSGTVFFSGCNMRCVFCQNREISLEGRGREISVLRLAEIFRELQDEGVHNINLVTPTHFADKIAEALKIAALDIPASWNSSGYESVECLKSLEGLVQIYMPDLKYTSGEFSARYSAAPDYPAAAKAAVMEMYRQTGACVFDEDGLLKSGVLIRHLILPGRLDDAFDVIDWVSESFPRGAVLLSLMSQFVPLADKAKYPELSHPLERQEYERAESYLLLSGIENGYFQDLSSATDELIPEFDGTGI